VRASLKLGAQAAAIAVVAALAVVLVWRLTHQTPPPKVGRPAPAFTLRRLDGKGSISLASLRGKTVVLNFWASFCYACKFEAPVLERLWRQERRKGVVVLGVDSNDSTGDARRFVRAHGITYPVVSDPYGSISANGYDAVYLPVTYVLDPRGRVVGGSLFGPISDGVVAADFARYLRAAQTS
jgi:cytochrome c biogenesis protein CcmG, thiol:disulfide interchange protein DsbE